MAPAEDGEKMLWRFLGSVRLTLGVLLTLAGLAAVGTLPREWGPGDDPYGHPAFLTLLSLLALNIAACTVQRLATRRRAALGSILSCRSLSDATLHLSLLVILCSGVLKGLGEVVLTQNIHVGGLTQTAYDWRARTDTPLEFTLAVEDFQEELYPALARVGVSRRDTGEGLSHVDLREGGEAVSTSVGLHLRLVEFQRPEGVAHLEVGESDSASARIALNTSGDEGREVEYGSYRLVVLAFKSQPRSVRSLISIRQRGQTVREGWLAPNEPISHGGLRISLTAWGRDREGRSFVGIQMNRNPGAPLFWVGCVLLALAVPAFLACRRQATASPDPDEPRQAGERYAPATPPS